MKAVVFNEYGGPDVLQYSDLDTPTPGPTDALVRVHAAGVSGVDLLIRSGQYRPNPGFPHVLGGGFAGEVVELGSEAHHLAQIGQRVFAWAEITCERCEACLTGNPNRCAFDFKYLGAHLQGTYAQYVRVPAKNLVGIPDNLSWTEAAAFTSVFGPAWHMLIAKAKISAGETVLIQAASSGVSSAAIQIAKVAGAYVYAVTSAQWKADKAKALGADEVHVPTDIGVAEWIKDRTGKRGVDVVVDHVGGDVFTESIRCLTRGGRLVTTGATAGYESMIPLGYVFHKELSVIGSNSSTKPELERMVPLLASGKLKPVVDSVFPLQDAASAHRHLASRSHFGKVVLLVDHDGP